MSRSRLGAGLSVGIACIFLVLLLPLAHPVKVEARWTPHIGSGLPRDPGTPFEEPEVKPADPFGDTQDGLHCSVIGGGAQPVALAADVAKPAVHVAGKIMLRRLALFLWHVQ
jgi:hypothetical protein